MILQLLTSSLLEEPKEKQFQIMYSLYVSISFMILGVASVYNLVEQLRLKT